MSRTHIATLTLAVTALAAAGCGASHQTTSSATLTRADLIAKADAICARVHVVYHANGYKSASDIVRLAPRVAAYERAATGELRRLAPPASLAGDWTQIVNGFQLIADDTSKLGQAAKAGNPAALTPLLSAASKVQQHALAIAARDGFKDCARVS